MAKSYRFEPKTIEIAAGETVTWTNDDNFTHTVEVDGQEDHKVEQGESVESRSTTPGTYDYVCTLHSRDMDGDGDRPVSARRLRRDVVILACAISAGIHGALVPDHFDEGDGAGLGFVPPPSCSSLSSSG